jgi:shikimate dehydrogenase
MTARESAASASASADADRYAVIGHPVEHSLSPKIHQLFAQQTGQALTYEKLPAPVDGFAMVAEAFFAAGGKGLNVTVPFKGAAAQWVQECESAAAAAGAVNTISVRSGRYLGYNTDGIGLTTDLSANLGWQIEDKSLLVLGAGGAVNGIIRPLLALRPRSLTVANRSVDKAQSLVRALATTESNVKIDCCALDAVMDAMGAGYDVVVNGTSAGLAGEGALIAPAAARGAYCYDLLYNVQVGAQTPFCAWAAAAGAASVSDGLGMLVEQAAAAFYLWRGVRPDTARVQAELTRAQADKG